MVDQMSSYNGVDVTIKATSESGKTVFILPFEKWVKLSELSEDDTGVTTKVTLEENENATPKRTTKPRST